MTKTQRFIAAGAALLSFAGIGMAGAATADAASWACWPGRGCFSTR